VRHGPGQPRSADRNLWVALPELAGSVFHSHLLHARSVGTPVTWRAFYGPAGRWLTATAELVERLLQVYLREASEQLTEGPPGAAAGEAAASADEDADRDRLRFLAEVSESVISTRDTGETAIRLESYLAAADISLSTDLLDRIDELVAPGVTVNPDDNSYGDHSRPRLCAADVRAAGASSRIAGAQRPSAQRALQLCGGLVGG